MNRHLHIQKLVEQETQMNEPWLKNWSFVMGLTPLSGGQGSIYKVVNLHTEQVGALKVLHSNSGKPSERRHRMAQEVHSLRLAEGNGIPRILEHNMDQVDQVSIPLYFVAKWIEGRTLTQYVNGKPLPIEIALELISQLARILAICHSKGVLHRDIKPDNLIVDNAGKLFLVDFGISAMSDAEVGWQTELGQELGNRFLRIPDMAAGRDRRDPRADITFTIGIFFYLLTGRAPRLLVDERGLPPHVAMSSYLPEALIGDLRWKQIARILHVGFQPAVDLRFQRAMELEERIKEILHPSPSSDAPPPTRLAIEVDAYLEVVSSATAKSRMAIEANMLDSAKALEMELKRLADENGLQSIHNAGYAWIEVAGRKVTFTYTLVRKNAMQPQVNMNHIVWLPDDQSSYVEAKYRVDSLEEVIYYKGLASDMELLHEAMLQQAEDIFALVFRHLNKKLLEAFGV